MQLYKTNQVKSVVFENTRGAIKHLSMVQLCSIFVVNLFGIPVIQKKNFETRGF